MFNKSLFRDTLVEHNLTIKKAAQIVGINEVTLYRKMSGESDFTRNEIQLFREKLSLSESEMNAIFFA